MSHAVLLPPDPTLKSQFNSMTGLSTCLYKSWCHLLNIYVSPILSQRYFMAEHLEKKLGEETCLFK